LGKDLGFSSRYIRTLLDELERENILTKKREGWNRSNTYRLTKSLTADRNSSSSKPKKYKKSSSPHLGSKFPLHQGTSVPPINTYLKGKDKKKMSKKGLEHLRKEMCKLRLMKDLPQKVKPTNKEE
jgi:DNA-binding transcriptional regulator PaaX